MERCNSDDPFFLFLGAFDLAKLREVGAYFRESANLDDKHRQAAQALGGKLLHLAFCGNTEITRAPKHYQVSDYAEKIKIRHPS